MLAHSRRQKENDTFTDIAESLPIQENAKDLDKASILRVAIHYLKLRDVVQDGDQLEQAEHMLDENGEDTCKRPFYNRGCVYSTLAIDSLEALSVCLKWLQSLYSLIGQQNSRVHSSKASVVFGTHLLAANSYNQLGP